jgi:F-type H+-transporting ATPase subunit b
MKRFAHLTLALGIVFAPLVFAQGPNSEASAREKKAEEESLAKEKALAPWKWANFLILAGALGYAAGKHGPPFFASRGARIRQDIDDADALRIRAEARTAEVERRLASLEAEIAVIREESKRETEAAAARLAGEAAARIAKLQASSEQEIASAGKAARTELRRYSAQLSIGLAEQKLRARMTPQAQDSLVDGFEHGLETAKDRTL